MFTSPSTQVAAYAALQTAYRRAAEQALREGGDRRVPPVRRSVGRVSGALAGVAVALTLLQTVAAGFAPAAETAPVVAAAPAATAVR